MRQDLRKCATGYQHNNKLVNSTHTLRYTHTKLLENQNLCSSSQKGV